MAGRGWIRLGMLAATVAAALILPGAIAASASHVDPVEDVVFHCAQVDEAWTELTVEPIDGDAGDGTLSVTIAASGQTFDWTASIGVDAVLVRGPSSTAVYAYDPEETADDGLAGPLDPETEEPSEIVAILFCYDLEASPTPTVSPGVTVLPTTEVPSAVPSARVLGRKVLAETGSGVAPLARAGLLALLLGTLGYAAGRQPGRRRG